MITNLAGIIILTGVIGIFAAQLIFGRQRKQAFRIIPAVGQLKRSIGYSVEAGRRIHVSIGSADFLSGNAASGLVGLTTLERIAAYTIISDRPPIISSGRGEWMILGQDTLQYNYRKSNVPALHDPLKSRFTGVSPWAYAAGTFSIMDKEKVMTNLLIGDFGIESGLMIDKAARQNLKTFAASNSLTAQAIFYANADEPLIGEEVFALPAYFKAGAGHEASLKTQDILRWLIIGLLTVGAVLKIITLLLGANIL